MENKIYSLLKKFRLQDFYRKFLEIGVKDESDFLDSIDHDTLNQIGLSQVEKTRFENMKKHIEKMGSSSCFSTVVKSTDGYRLMYKFPKCSETKTIIGLDPTQNTLEDVMLRIGFQEGLPEDQAVCLYSFEGMPLTDDPFFNTWSLNERHIENGAEIYAIFTPKKNIQDSISRPPQSYINHGNDTIRCHIMLKGDYEVKVDMDEDTLLDVRKKLSCESGIPTQILQMKNNWEYDAHLRNLQISSDTVIDFSLSSFDMKHPDILQMFTGDIEPVVPQTQKGMSVFFSALYAIYRQHFLVPFPKVIAYIRKLSSCNALAQALCQLLCRKETCTRMQKIAIVEGLYILFRELLPSLEKRTGPQIIEDQEVFEHASVCWAYILSQSESQSSDHECYAPISLLCEGTNEHLCEPVRIPEHPGVFDRDFLLRKLRNGESIPNCPELKETSLRKATDIEKILLCLPLWMTSFPLWISYKDVSGNNFRVNADKTFKDMTDDLTKYPHLVMTPPLQLKSWAIDEPRLVFLKKDYVGVYTGKDKMKPQTINVFDCLQGKMTTADPEQLANEIRDVRNDQTLKTTRIPQEAILVLLDSSSSMSDECFDSQSKMMRIDAVKQMFHAFANRSMAYNFHHIVGLDVFGGRVKTIHTFTETLETFKEYVDTLQARGKTPLYDALNGGISKLKLIKEQFPDCRLRILCLTDGHDVGSKSNPVDVAVGLMDLKITVDAVIVGDINDNVLHGISNVTGGCCFKPETLKNGIKLFEMETVLSLERRKPKNHYNASSVRTLKDLTKISNTCGYDDKPMISLPVEIDKKVTLTENVLKKKIQESKNGRFLEKDKRIIEELKNLHCNPHPYCEVFPVEDNFCFWKILMSGPPDTPYEKGTFELYCEFGKDYPVKPPTIRFLTPIYHCNVNNTGRICHNIFDRNYSAHITMREILDAIFGLLIAPEPEDPLDSVLAQEYISSRSEYQAEAKKTTEKEASASVEDMEKKLLGMELKEIGAPQHLTCPLTKKIFNDPVETPDGHVYERRAIENHLEIEKTHPINKTPLRKQDLRSSVSIKRMVEEYRRRQIQETAV